MLDELMDGKHVLNIWNIYNTTCNSPHYQLLSLSWADNSRFEWNLREIPEYPRSKMILLIIIYYSD